MKKILLSAAVLCSLSFTTLAQTKTKTTTKTSPAAKTTTTTTTTGTSVNQGAAAERPAIIETEPVAPAPVMQETPAAAAGGLKAAGGEITLEANVNPFAGPNAVTLSNSLQQVRVRYFLSDDMAFRLGGHLSFNTSVPATDTKTRLIDFSIAPGIEKHFAGTNRLSPYLGAELLLGLRSAHSEFDGPGSSGVEVKGSFGPADNTNRGYFLVGLGAVGGFDFYVARHLYVGYELNLELSNQSFSEIETITTSTTGNVSTAKNEGYSSFSFGPNVRNGIRIGFVF